MSNPNTKSVQAQKLTIKHITGQTPMGMNLVSGGTGATVIVWAPAARQVSVRWNYVKDNKGVWSHQKEGVLTKIDSELWAGFVPNISAGARYMFHIVGPENGSVGPKRDPYARDLTDNPPWPNCQCLVYNPKTFPWHDAGWKPPLFHDLCIYQLHIGTWFFPANRNSGTFLDVITRLPYLKSLGINAIQPLPKVEFPTMTSLGYNGVDYFSPETDYGVKKDDPDLKKYLNKINAILLQENPAIIPYKLDDIIETANQFRMMVDMCHVMGIAVILDVVYNHAGGDFTDEGLYFFDRRPRGNQNDSLYFTDHGWAGGLVFAYWNDNVKQFLIDNAKYYLLECHCDGFRYDEVSVIKNEGGHHGWLFCQYVTDTCHYVKPEAIHIAECWPVEQAVVSPTSKGGAGFDATQNDGLRDAVRSAIAAASGGKHAFVDMDAVARQLASPILHDSWRAVQCVENHDIVFKGRGSRISKLADGSNSRSWYARSRSRVAMGLTLTAPGIPHVFMGQEILEDKQWHDDPNEPNCIWWEGLQYDKAMIDFLRFTRELIDTRKRLPGLKGNRLNVFHVHNNNRVLAFHRWIEGIGQDVVVIASLKETTFYRYELGFPGGGYWREVFNSDVYDNWVNPTVAGNSGGIHAYGSTLHGMPVSAPVTIPANGLVIFSR